MTKKEFWNIVEKLGWGTKTTDYEAISDELSRTLTPDQIEEFRDLCYKFERALGDTWGGLEGFCEICPGFISNDGYGDFLAHSVGLGKKEYEAVLADTELAIRRFTSHDYVESFAYAIPWPDEEAAWLADT